MTEEERRQLIDAGWRPPRRLTALGPCPQCGQELVSSDRESGRYTIAFAGQVTNGQPIIQPHYAGPHGCG